MRGSVSEHQSGLGVPSWSVRKGERSGERVPHLRRLRPSPDRGPLSPAHNNGDNKRDTQASVERSYTSRNAALAQHPAYIRHELLRKDVRDGAGLDVSTFDLNVERNTRP